jgi:hypothetical protein
MTEAATIDNEELAVLCDIVSGWGVRKWGKSPEAKQQALNRLMAHGYVEAEYEDAATRYRHDQGRNPLCPAERRHKRRLTSAPMMDGDQARGLYARVVYVWLFAARPPSYRDK